MLASEPTYALLRGGAAAASVRCQVPSQGLHGQGEQRPACGAGSGSRAGAHRCAAVSVRASLAVATAAAPPHSFCTKSSTARPARPALRPHNSRPLVPGGQDGAASPNNRRRTYEHGRRLRNLADILVGLHHALDARRQRVRHLLACRHPGQSRRAAPAELVPRPCRAARGGAGGRLRSLPRGALFFPGVACVMNSGKLPSLGVPQSVHTHCRSRKPANRSLQTFHCNFFGSLGQAAWPNNWVLQWPGGAAVVMGKGKKHNHAAQGQAQGSAGTAQAPHNAAAASKPPAVHIVSAPDPSRAVLALHPHGHAVAVALGGRLRVYDFRCWMPAAWRGHCLRSHAASASLRCSREFVLMKLPNGA